MLGRAHTFRSDFEEAENSFKGAEKDCPKDLQSELYVNWAVVERRAGRYKPAYDLAEKARKLDPDNPRILNELSVATWELARQSGADQEKAKAQQAESLAEKAMTAASGIGDTSLLLSAINNYSYFSVLRGGQDRIERALRLTEGFSRAGVTRPTYLDTRGYVCLASFNHYVSLSKPPQHVQYLLDEAIDCFKKAQQTDPADPDYVTHLAEALTLKKRVFGE